MVGKSLLALMLVACGSKPFPIEEDAGRTTDAAKMDAPGPDGCTMTAWYVDQDGDGYGRSYNYQMACQAPNDGQRWVQMGGDCADQDSHTNPGISEPSEFPVSGEHPVSGAFDHNCDGKETETWPPVSGYCDTGCIAVVGWYEPPARCGESRAYLDGCSVLVDKSCGAHAPLRQQTCL
jgi:hypothetical protein